MSNKQPCSICGEPTPIVILGWWGECPECLFLIEQFNMSIEEVKKRRAKRIKPNKEVRS